LSNQLLDSIRAMPGVQTAGITSNIALSGGTSPSTVAPDTTSANANDPPVLPSVVSVTPGYFEAMSTRLVRGRNFADADRDDSPPVAIVDERLAARFWPGQDPIGKGIYRGQSKRFEIVGVVRDVKFDMLAGRKESAGAAYFPHTQSPIAGRLRWIAIKAATDPTAMIRSVRTALSAIDPQLPLSDVQTMSERTAQSIAAQRLAMSVATMFGVIALLLSIVGIYGVLAYIVAQKTREIGIRLALGSTARNIFQLFFREGLALIAIGLAIGLAGALAVGRALNDQVFGVAPSDPIVLGSVAVATGAIALLACISPARRAARVDPLTVLNDQ
jgi:putative ABC transport system permease protein